METITKKADCLRLVNPGRRYLIEVNSQKAVDAARAFIGPRCYRQLEIGGVFAAQIEIVIDEAGEYNGYSNKWVAVSFIPAALVPAVFTWLENNGFSGCLATFETEAEDGPREFERIFSVGDFTPDAAADYDEEMTNIDGEKANIYYLDSDSCVGFSFPDADGVTVYVNCNDAEKAFRKLSRMGFIF